MVCQPANKQLQPTVVDKVPSHLGQRAAAELRRYTAFASGMVASRLIAEISRLRAFAFPSVTIRVKSHGRTST